MSDSLAVTRPLHSANSLLGYLGVWGAAPSGVRGSAPQSENGDFGRLSLASGRHGRWLRVKTPNFEYQIHMTPKANAPQIETPKPPDKHPRTVKHSQPSTKQSFACPLVLGRRRSRRGGRRGDRSGGWRNGCTSAGALCRSWRSGRRSGRGGGGPLRCPTLGGRPHQPRVARGRCGASGRRGARRWRWGAPRTESTARRARGAAAWRASRAAAGTPLRAPRQRGARAAGAAQPPACAKQP